MNYYDCFNELCEALEGPGAFLVVEDGKGRVNAMTIGWAQLGVVWSEPALTVLVRPSRHTHELLETAKGFTVCVPRRGEMKKELAFCGSKSGREYDKVRACGLALKDGAAPGLKYIDGCELVYHCALGGAAGLKREQVAPAALAKYYPGSETPHTVYFGKILKAEHLK
ncbi:MAG: flavin reductase [Elusimicrobiales bacterium]|nr:flavin reductase [Elusimicrobiales bacterium]